MYLYKLYGKGEANWLSILKGSYNIMLRILEFLDLCIQTAPDFGNLTYSYYQVMGW